MLREFWEDFVLVMETLEENQVDKHARCLAGWCIRWNPHATF